LHSWGGRFDHFAFSHFRPHEKTKMKNSGSNSKAVLEKQFHKSCPLGHVYDHDLHDAIAHLRILDGSLPEHPKFGRSVNFFAPAGTPKYWVKASTPVFGFFFYYTLDMAVCPYLASIFGMPIWHPTTEAEVDELMAAEVSV
jgi:hypothetical protein